MTLVVSDTSPLNLLIGIRQVSVLPSLFETVVIPTTGSLMKMRHSKAPVLVREFIQNAPEWVSIQNPLNQQAFPTLDSGEAAAINLALELKAPLMIDERAGRAIAKSNGLVVIGAIGILERAAELGLIADLEAVYHAVRSLPFHISEQILSESLERHRANRKS